MDHVATGFDRCHLGEEVGAGPEPAARIETAHLVCAEGVEVGAGRGNRDGHIRDCLAAVNTEERANGVRSFGDLGERCNGAEHVGDVSEGDHLRLQLHQRIESVPEDLAGYVVNGNEFEVGIHLARDLLPRDEICMMLGLGDQHHITTAQVRFAPRSRNKVERLGGAAEHHQFARWNVYIRSDARTCRLIPVSRHLGKRVRAAMWVRIRGEEELRHRINNALRALPRCGAVEIVQWPTARLRLEDWVFGANLYGIECAVCVMPHAHLSNLSLRATPTALVQQLALPPRLPLG